MRSSAENRLLIAPTGVTRSTRKAIFSGRSPQPQPREATLPTHLEIQRPHLFVVRKVTGVNELERRLEAGGGVIARRANPDLGGSLDRARRDGRIVSVAPGVYCAAGRQDDPWVRLRAVALWAGPDAIFTGFAAAKLTFWESAPLGRIAFAVSRHGARSRSGVYVEQRRIDPRFTLRRSGIAVTSPALTAVDLAATELGGDVIDRVLRLRTATLEQMWSALRAHSHRAGNAARAQLLNDSRDLPWSTAERLQHRLLRAARVVGWKANQWVCCGTAGYWVDVLFKRQRLILEIDGWETHGTRLAFEEDRRRRNDLVLAGYAVLNFTYRQLVDDPEWVMDCIRHATRGKPPAGEATRR